MSLRSLVYATILFLIPFFTFAQKVGINTLTPLFDLDVRGTSDKADGGELQLATPSMSNFLRFFGGRIDDPNPFMAFHDLDTFHFVTTLPDFSTYTRRMTLFPDGKLGLGTDKPAAELEIRTADIDDGTEIRLSNSNDSHFLRLFSGKPTNPRPAVYWNFGSVLDFARFDGSLSYIPFLSLDGKTIDVLNNNGSVFLGENAGEADDGSFNTAVGSFSIPNNITGIQNTALGYNAGGGSNVGSSFSRNILIGYQAGLNITASDRLYIENSSSATPLVYGEFDSNLLRINGRQEITGDLNLSQGITSGIALRVNGQEALWSDGSYFSYGYGTGHNYFAKPLRIGPLEGSTSPFADLHIVDNAGISNLSIESHNDDAFLQLAGTTNDANQYWTIRRRNSDGDLEWRHNGFSFMKLTTDANLGLGVSNPQKTLEVAGDSRVFKSVNSAIGNESYVSSIENTSNNNGFQNNGLKIMAGHNTIGQGSTRSIFIAFSKPNGNLIGGVSQLDNNGIVYYQTSDRRRKRNIIATNVGIEKLMQIKVRDYNWIDDQKNHALTTGFIAQELYDVYPSAAKKGGRDSKLDPWQVAPTQLIPLMVKSTQDQQKEIEKLKSENEKLIQRIERLEKLLGAKK